MGKSGQGAGVERHGVFLQAFKVSGRELEITRPKGLFAVVGKPGFKLFDRVRRR